MKNRLPSTLAYLSFVFTFGLISCLKVKEYPIEPQLTSISTTRLDSNFLSVSLGFTDGDGDIGLLDTDTFPPFNPQGEFYYNLEARYFIEDSAGQWTEKTSFGYRIKPLTPKGKIKVLEGDLTISPMFLDSDTPAHRAKYSFQLIDKALHKSNTIESDAFLIGK